MLFPNGFDDELSRSPYKGYMACQRPEVFCVFNTFIKNERPNIIVEIGTCFGGLSLALHEICKERYIQFVTFDIVLNDTLIDLKDKVKDINLRIENIFEETSRECYDVKDNFKNYLEDFSAPRLILCDGGNKIGEFNAFAKLMKKGDILMAHDFSYNIETFNKDSAWGWKEIEESDITKSMQEYNLFYYKMHIWRPVAWCCVKKLF